MVRDKRANRKKCFLTNDHKATSPILFHKGIEVIILTRHLSWKEVDLLSRSFVTTLILFAYDRNPDFGFQSILLNRGTLVVIKGPILIQ